MSFLRPHDPCAECCRRGRATGKSCCLRGQPDLLAQRQLPEDEGWGRGRRPAINSSVHDALNFAKWLSRKTDAHYRLPTEVDWEHAARAGSMTSYPWGEELGANRANRDGCGSQWDNQ